jgi:hypothetical protein
MNLIKNNPYRIIGILAGASAKEQDRQIKRLRRLIEAEHTPQFSFELKALSELIPTLSELDEAESNLNLDKDRINAALFWFYIGNPISDEVAFDALKSNNIAEAITIWTKLADKQEVTSRNASAFFNLGTLYLSGILEGAQTAITLYKKGIEYKLKFLCSEYALHFTQQIADSAYQTTNDDLQLSFLRQLQAEVTRSKTITEAKLLEILNKSEFSVKTAFLDSHSAKHINQIDRIIEESKNARKNNGKSTHKQNLTTIKKLTDGLHQLNKFVPSNYKTDAAADKVAEEILEISIQYFNTNHDNETDSDYVANSIELASKALSIAKGNRVRDRIQESILVVEKHLNHEIELAIQFLKSVKIAYEQNKAEIERYVSDLEKNPDFILGIKTINRKVVAEQIDNFLDWSQIDKFVDENLSIEKLKKIKKTESDDLKREFFMLATWLKSIAKRGNSINAAVTNYTKISPTLPFTLFSSEITNTDDKPIYRKYIRFIGLKIYIQPTETKNVVLYVKYIKPNGQTRSSANSPSGYTLQSIQSISPERTQLSIAGWGSADTCTFEVGEHKIEVYVDEFLIHTKKFKVELAPSEKLDIELAEAEKKQSEIRKTTFLSSEIQSSRKELEKIKEWQFLRSQGERDRQIREQQQKIQNLINKAENQKNAQINAQQKIINEIKDRIKKAAF